MWESSGNIQIGRRKNVRQNERLAVSLKKLMRTTTKRLGLKVCPKVRAPTPRASSGLIRIIYPFGIKPET